MSRPPPCGPVLLLLRKGSSGTVAQAHAGSQHGGPCAKARRQIRQRVQAAQLVAGVLTRNQQLAPACGIVGTSCIVGSDAD